MAPQPRNSGMSKKGMAKKAKRIVTAEERPVPNLGVEADATSEDNGSTCSSFLPDQEVIGTFDEDQGPAGHHRPHYPSLEIEDEELFAREGVGFPRTPPMMPWKVHPSKDDLEKLRSSPIDLQQSRVLEGLSEDALSHIETLDGQSSNISTSTSLERLQAIRMRVPWRWDGQFRTMSFPHVSRVGGTRPYRCSNGDCANRLKLVTSLSALKKHLDTHIPRGMRPYVCEVCPSNAGRENFLYPKDLERHFIKVHQVEELALKAHLKSAKCIVCEETFSRPDGLERHNKLFDGNCIGHKRSRRKSAPVKNMLANSQLSPALTGDSSVLSDLTGTSAFTGLGRPMTSSATSASAQRFELGDCFNIDPTLREYQPSPFQ